MWIALWLALVSCGADVISRPAKPGSTGPWKLASKVELGAVPAAAELLEGRVFVAAGDKVHLLDARTGCARWSFQAKAPVVTNLLVAAVRAGRNAVLFADAGGRLYAVDLYRANAEYEVTLPAKPTGRMEYRDTRLYVATDAGTVAYWADAGREVARSEERLVEAPRGDILVERDGFRVRREGTALLVYTTD
jgi:hypothetical protein